MCRSFRNGTRNEETQTNELTPKSSSASTNTGPPTVIDEDSGQELLTSAQELFVCDTFVRDRNASYFPQTHVPYFIPPDPVGSYLQECGSYSHGTGHQAFVDLYACPRRNNPKSVPSEIDSPDYDEVANYQCVNIPNVISPIQLPERKKHVIRSCKQNGTPSKSIQRTENPIQRKHKVIQKKSGCHIHIESGSDDSYMCPVTLIDNKSRFTGKYKTRPHSFSESETSSNMGIDVDEKARKVSIASMSCLSEVTVTPENTSDLQFNERDLYLNGENSEDEEAKAIEDAINHIENIGNSISDNIIEIVGHPVDYTDSLYEDDDWDKRSAISL